MKKKTEYEVLLRRFRNNPIITAGDVPYPANSVFNPAAAEVDGKVVLLLRVEDRSGHSHLTRATSRDGVSGWIIDGSPTLPPRPEQHPEEWWGIEDPRATWIEELGKWIVAYTAYSRGGPLVALAATEDFETFERLGPVMAPEDKDAALFPVRFGGRWALLHRPAPAASHLGAHIWISFSPDLKHWGEHQILMKARKGGWWDADKIGLCTPPLLTERGWLILYHGVRWTAYGSIYRLGLALLDAQDPRRVVRRSREWIFGPRESYERTGDVPQVVFPCGWIRSDDELKIYYGAADTCVAVATASVTQLLDWLEEHDSVRK